MFIVENMVVRFCALSMYKKTYEWPYIVELHQKKAKDSVLLHESKTLVNEHFQE